ncbi:DUF4236 domain-containing protein [Barrientosiimonas marina]|uniref:DUF4236 domain-containing protein n=1 Tax=Lentibacillus kimchii TaxID=1542911 RepID=A0ABW2UU54_9BACI
MALRFRRSVKLGKGIKLNVSKGGVGMSLGTTGLRQSFHSTGRGTQTIGIPGTGLSYVKTKNLSGKRSSNNSISQISQNVSQNEAAVAEYNNYVHAITHLHTNTPETTDWQALRAESPPFQPGETGPGEADAQADYQAYQPNFLARLIKPLATKQKKELKQAIKQAKKQDTAAYEKWEKWHDLAQRVLKGEADAYIQAVKENPAFADVIERGVSLGVPNAREVEAELRVKPNDVAPNKKVTLTKTRKVSKQKMGKKDYYKIVKDFVCGYALWVSRALFASLPIESCVIHVTANALNTATGNRQRKVLLSVRIDEQMLNQLNFEHLDPSDAMENFDHHMNHLKTKGFRPVKRLTVK